MWRARSATTPVRRLPPAVPPETRPRVRPPVPRPEYPRPQLVRDEWASLNGEWEFVFDDGDLGLREGWQDGRTLVGKPGRITVPFPYQSRMSGVDDKTIHEVVWYARSFTLPESWGLGPGRAVLLHFGAVDYRTTVWVNGQEVGHNRGGHVPFWFDIAPYLSEGENRLTMRVEDRQDPHQPRGKQSSSGVPRGIDYYCTTGIWQTVWLEPVRAVRIDHLRIDPDAAGDAVEVVVHLHAPSAGWTLLAEVLETVEGEAVVARTEERAAGAVARLRLSVPSARRWSPESPHLYGLRVQLLEPVRDGGTHCPLDEVKSYFGLRSVRLEGGRYVLNGAPVYLAMVMDQGYWPDGYLAAPSDAALRADVEWAKRLGFNGARKHQKIEDPRWLYWCDRLGLLVWEEMPSARTWSPEAEEALLAEWRRAVVRDRNHPCVITWVPLNESMGLPGLADDHPGQYAYVERVVAATREADPTRPVIDNDGWEHTDVGDVCAVHDYTPTAEGLRERYRERLAGGPLPAVLWNGVQRLFLRDARYRGQPIVLSEVGGFLAIPPEVPSERRDVLYSLYAAYSHPEELLARYADLVAGIRALPFVAGFCYTQLTDIELELNGLLTYDRRPKIDPTRVAAIHRSVGGAGAAA
jgi:beta-galactosidase/beta-glucuronidase